VALLRCLVVTAIMAVVITSVWAATVTFGPLLSSIVAARGAVDCITAVQVSTGATAVRDTGSLSGV